MELIYLNHELLKQEMQEVFKNKNVCDDSIKHVVNSMVQTSLRGVDSHGIHLFPHYCKKIDGGRVSKDPKYSYTQTAASAGYVDAADGFGHHIGSVAIDKACEMASETGMAAINVRNSSHFGAAAYFALQASERGMIGMAFTNADALVKAKGSTQSFFGTNPICFTTPLQNEEPFCLDMATSMVSWNKIKNYRREGNEIPDSWAYDGEGRSVTNPNDARSLEPAGDYKGFGLGMMVDIFCGILANGLISKDVMAMYETPLDTARKVSHFFMVIDPTKFLSLNEFRENMQSMVDRIRSMPRQEGVEEVMVPGDPEKKTKAIRLKQGIPILKDIFEDFLAISPGFQKAVVE
ncbi:MAG: hypothetical protein CL840_14310 [Crocinitomicaceae bacterium]|nr:hypothetical protein [Crocinitomicaceae bacterium]|tara:strand:- start:11005 stop:12051 length:1047 start_codon:yes stop_codon:yes gene_type:complete